MKWTPATGRAPLNRVELVRRLAAARDMTTVSVELAAGQRYTGLLGELRTGGGRPTTFTLVGSSHEAYPVKVVDITLDDVAHAIVIEQGRDAEEF